MEANGWTINADGDNHHCPAQIILQHCLEILDTCGSDTFYGLMDGDGKIASVSATFKGIGRITISFGNCWDDGEVVMYLNDEVQASASGNKREEIINLPYKTGDVLEIKGVGGAIIKLYYFFFIERA